jgi:hypothetical protein
MIVARTSTPQAFSHLAKHLACAAFALVVLIAVIVFFGTYFVIGRASYRGLPVMITIGGIVLSMGVFKTDLHRRAQQFVDKLRTNPDLLSLNPARIEPFLISQLKEHPWVELIYVTDSKGMQLTGNIATSGVDENVRGKDWSKRPWFVEPATTGKVYLSGLYRSVATNDFCFTASVPVCDGHAISGVIGADINFRFLSELESGRTFGA